MKIRSSIIWLVVVAVLLTAAVLWFGEKTPVKMPPAVSTETNVAPPVMGKPNALANAPKQTNGATAIVGNPSGTTIQSQSLSQPQDRAELLKAILQANDADIVFYGRVVDETGSAVGGAEISFNVQYENPNHRGNQPGKIMADGNGSFTISGYKGANLTVMPKKTGYALVATETTFRYSQISPGYFVPDMGNPITFKMQKLQGAEALVSFNKSYKLRYTDAPISFDLLAGQEVAAGGDLRVTVVRPVGIISGHNPQDWSVRVDAVDGGLAETTVAESRITYTAPESGYEPGKTVIMSEASNSWAQIIHQMFFVRSRNGQVYSKVLFSFRINSDPNDFMYVTFSGVANTNGSRNWEATATP